MLIHKIPRRKWVCSTLIDGAAVVFDSKFNSPSAAGNTPPPPETRSTFSAFIY